MRSVKAFILTVLVLVIGSNARAQSPVYHPGDTIRVSITFEGPDAARITSAFMVLATSEPASDNQPGFSKQCQSDSTAVSSTTVVLTCKILDNQASGEYKLTLIRAVINQSAPVAFEYAPPNDFRPKAFKVENPNHVVKPTIKDVKELPKS